RRSRATPATRRSATSGAPSSCSRGSARTRAETTTSPPYATTRGSRRLFAERVGLALDELSPVGCCETGHFCEPTEEQAAVVRWIFDRVARDGWSTRSIAE